MWALVRFLAGTDNPAVFTDNFGESRDGIARTRNDWGDDLGATPKQMRRILEVCTERGRIVRAQRAWGKYRLNRMHVAVTDEYMAELAKCIQMGVVAYRDQKAAKPVTVKSDAKGHPGATPLGPSGPSHSVHPTWPTKGQALRLLSDSGSDSHKTACPLIAEHASPEAHESELDHDRSLTLAHEPEAIASSGSSSPLPPVPPAPPLQSRQYLRSMPS